MTPLLVLIGGTFQEGLPRIEEAVCRKLSDSFEVTGVEYPRFKNLLHLLTGRYSFVERINHHLKIIHSFGLPSARQCLWLNRLNHGFNRLILPRDIKNSLKQTILLTFTPEAVFLPEILGKAAKIIYFVVDDYPSLPAWKHPSSQRHFRYLEKQFLKKAGLVITSSWPLYERYRKLHPKVVHFPTPIDFPSENKIAGRIPEDLARLKPPYVGFAGGLYDWRTDPEFLISLLKAYPQYSFVFIGQAQTKLPLSNFHYLGYKKDHELDSYLANFSAGLIPYKTDTYGRYAYPVKVNEYFRFGLPVVSTSLPALKNQADRRLLYWSKTDREFILNLKKAVTEKNLSLKSARIKEALSQSWPAQKKYLIKLLKN